MDTLLTDIEKFCATHGLSEWQFGEMALNDRHFIRQLREEREPRRKTVERVRDFMVTYRPTPPTMGASPAEADEPTPTRAAAA